MQDETNCTNCPCVNSGVCCEVEKCAHNDGNHCCTADKITVKNRMAIVGEATMCETFEEV